MKAFVPARTIDINVLKMLSCFRLDAVNATVLLFCKKKLHRHSMVTKYIVYCIENRKKYDKQLKIKLPKCGADLPSISYRSDSIEYPEPNVQ